MKKVADAVVSFEIINYILDLFCIFWLWFNITDYYICHFLFDQMGWKEKEATGEFIPRGNVDALRMVLGKDHRALVEKNISSAYQLLRFFLNAA